ncbi:MAG: ClpXP protease specificity-enhancing factor SspB [Holosporales bacterium]|jgi:hypothetical protein|nr:ClpXP protease specificity-enhancing factor SspB [Holosporales bacterium]
MSPSIPYGAYAREALLGVVRRVLKEAACDGISPPHHFYVSFRTDHEQTLVPDFLKQAYPDQTAIVLRHQFWDLSVEAHGFSVVLSFNGTKESLFIPFNALTGFSDPSVKFSLQFLPEFGGGIEVPEPPSSPQTPDTSPESEGPKDEKKGQIVDFDSFRKK